MTIYLDGHASTQVAPEAIDAMVEAMRHPGNPHGSNASGALAGARVEKARGEVADLLGASPNEILFTSGATEANNLAVLGIARAMAASGDARRTVVTSALEHPSVSRPADMLKEEGFDHVVLPVSTEGRVAVDLLQKVLERGDVALVSITAADGEIAVLQPVSAIAEACAARGVVFHCDASQAAGRIPLDVGSLAVDAMTVSSHKMYGPSGIGALYLSASSPRPLPVLFGGGQERGLRPGTVPVGLAAGFGAAASLVRRTLDADARRSAELVDRFQRVLQANVPLARVNGPSTGKLPGSVSVQIPDLAADAMLALLGTRVSVSTTSACSAGQIQPSQALRSIGLTWKEASSSFRLVFDRYCSDEDADKSATEIANAIARLSVVTG